MTASVIAFFNNKGGVGKTSLVYHLAWMYADLGVRVVAADLDPQANLTSAFLDEDRLEELWCDDGDGLTVFDAIQPLLRGTGDIAPPEPEDIALPEPEKVDDSLALIVGDLALSKFEDHLSEAWPKCMDGDERSFRVMSAFWRILQNVATARQAQVILVDLGPNLGAINRAALLAADYVVVPLSPDLFSLQGLRNLGPALRRWQEQWKKRLEQNPAPDLDLPQGHMRPAGYIVLQHSVRLDRPVKAYERWIARIPETYRKSVLNEQAPIPEGLEVSNDPHCLALLKHFRSLMPLAQEARKPMFHLKPADGAIGGHLQAVTSAYQDFKRLASAIAKSTRTPMP